MFVQLCIALFLCYCCLFVYSENSYFAICSCVKHEPDIAEWVEYHLRMGASKIYIFDNALADDNFIKKALLWYIKNDYVSYEMVDGLEAQRRSYEKCHKKYSHKHNFMAFIDADEFIVVTNTSQSIPSVLKEFEPYGALGLNWMEYGRSGHISKPAGGVLPNYHKCHPMTHVKLIANTKRFKSGRFYSPHELVHERDSFTVNEQFQRVNGFRTDNGSFSKIYLNHYVVKSIEDFARKSARGSGWKPSGKGKPWTYLNAVDHACTLDCPVLVMPEPNSRS